MAAAAQGCAVGGGIEPRRRAHGEFHLSRLGVADHRAHQHALDGAGEAGDGVEVVLADAQLLHQLLGQAADGHRAAAVEVHLGHHPGFQLQAAAGLDLKELAVDGCNLCTQAHAGSRRLEGLGGGIGEAEAAGVGGDGDVNRLGHFRGDLHAHGRQYLVDELAAPGAGGVEQGVGGIEGVAGVVVDAQLERARKALPALGQEGFGGHIHGHHGGVLRPVGAEQPFHAGQVPAGKLGIFPDPGVLAQASKPQTQRNGAAGGVAVGADVGEDQKVIPCPEPPGGFLRFLHRGIPPALPGA